MTVRTYNFEIGVGGRVDQSEFDCVTLADGGVGALGGDSAEDGGAGRLVTGCLGQLCPHLNTAPLPS